jgi:hypothetical protein
VLLLVSVYLTLFCFEFLGLSLVDKGKQPQRVPATAPLLSKALPLTLPQSSLGVC